jgi:hypothetical protein
LADRPHLNSKNLKYPVKEYNIHKFYNLKMMAMTLIYLNNLNSIAMNRKTSIRHGQNFHQDGIGTVTILLAIATVTIIFFSIYNAF